MWGVCACLCVCVCIFLRLSPRGVIWLLDENRERWHWCDNENLTLWLLQKKKKKKETERKTKNKTSPGLYSQWCLQDTQQCSGSSASTSVDKAFNQSAGRPATPAAPPDFRDHHSIVTILMAYKRKNVPPNPPTSAVIIQPDSGIIINR